MTPEEWKIWKRINARPAKALAAYPDLERQDFDETLDQTAAAEALRPMPVVVLTASDKFIDVVPKLIQAGELPPDTPPDFGAVVDRRTRRPRTNSWRSCPARCTSPTRTRDITSCSTTPQSSSRPSAWWSTR